MKIDIVLKNLERLHFVSPDELSRYMKKKFGGDRLSLRQQLPFIDKMHRHFKNLPRGKRVNGEFHMIDGYRNYKSWCMGVLNCTDRWARMMMAKEVKKSPNKAELTSASYLRCAAYIKRQSFLARSKKGRLVRKQILELLKYKRG